MASARFNSYALRLGSLVREWIGRLSRFVMLDERQFTPPVAT